MKIYLLFYIITFIFCDNTTINEIISSNANSNYVSACENIIPYKSFKYDLLPKSQTNSLNNSYISSSVVLYI